MKKILIVLSCVCLAAMILVLGIKVGDYVSSLDQTDDDLAVGPSDMLSFLAEGTSKDTADTSACQSIDTSAYQSMVDSAQATDEADGAGEVFAEKQVLVQFKSGMSAEDAENALQNIDAITTKTISQDDLNQAIPVVVLQVAETSTVAEAVNALSDNESIASVQRNYIYSLADTTTTTQTTGGTSSLTSQSTTIDDPLASKQWQLDDVGCYDAWEYARCSGTVGVAIIDTGCMTGHEDLSANIVGAYNSVTSQTGNDNVSDESSNGHGTHVAGIVAATTNNEIGVSGVSYNAKIIPIKAVNSAGGFDSSGLVSAYNYLLSGSDSEGWSRSDVASQNNVRVVNMSLGGKGGCSSEGSSYDALLLQAVDHADSAGILTVCAAGNYDGGNQYTEYPGDYSTCVSVMNLTSTDTLNSGSNRNVDGVKEGDFGKNICAPGTYIYSTTKDGSYGYKDGTSMASPVVAGIAAMVFAADPTLTPEECKQVLYDTADDLGDEGWDTTYAYGKVDAAAATKKVNTTSLAGAEISAIADAAYTGSAITPTPTVTLNGETLVLGTDYTIEYADNTDPGTATVTVRGTGAYWGRNTTTFVISSYQDDVLSAGSAGEVYTIGTKLDPTHVADIYCRSTADGANVQTWTGNQTPAQRFLVCFHEVDGDLGYYTFENVYSGKVLDVADGGVSSGTNVQQWDSNDSAAQQWVLVDAGSDYWKLRNVGSGCLLDVAESSAADGWNLQIWAADGTSAQQFCLDSCDDGPSSASQAYTIANVLISSRVVDVAYGSMAAGANVWLFDANGTAAQNFTFSYDESSGYYTIRRASDSNKVIDVYDAGEYDGANIQQWDANDSWAQKWAMVKNSDGTFTIYCACNGRCIDLLYGDTANYTNIQCWSSNNTSAQKWSLKTA